MTDLIGKIYEAHKLAIEVYDATALLKEDYIRFLLVHNPIGLVPKFWIIEGLHPTAYELSLFSDIDEGIMFSGEYFENVFYFTMPLDYIANPEQWLAAWDTDKRIEPMSDSFRPATGCECGGVFGCDCNGDIEKHLDNY
ncbi:MAG: hypothetical protein H9W81_08350 [Enterococcus sp.]|nr:hypothetical protein [Enterococcus sp.]